jgi:hypothetical protein
MGRTAYLKGEHPGSLRYVVPRYGGVFESKTTVPLEPTA